MSELTEQLFQVAIALPLHEILDLMDRLEDHVEPLLEPPTEPRYQLSPEWDEVIRRRIEDYESGKAKGIPWEEAEKMILAEGDDPVV